MIYIIIMLMVVGMFVSRKVIVDLLLLVSDYCRIVMYGAIDRFGLTDI